MQNAIPTIESAIAVVANQPSQQTSFHLQIAHDVPLADEQHHQHHDRRREHSVDDGTPVQRLDRVEAVKLRPKPTTTEIASTE
jgi:hypothetical protein